MNTSKPVKPPHLASTFLSWYCQHAQVEDLQGDIEELFYDNLEHMPIGKAKVKYWQQVLSLIFSYAIKKRKQHAAYHWQSYNPTHPVMIKNYFKSALRVISKNKVYSAINVLGLSLGICACITIYLVVRNEFSFDTFHPDKERIYRLVVEDGRDGEKWRTSAVPAPAPLAVRDEISGIEVVTAVHFYDPKISIPDGSNPPRQFEASDRRIIITDPEYFSVFKYTWLVGNPNLLNDPFKVVLSESRARNYFGSLSWDKIMGREIMYDSIPMSVTGIVQDWNKNTDFPATDFISFNTIKSSDLKNNTLLANWGSYRHSSQAFVKLNPGSSPEALTGSLTDLLRKYDPSDRKDKKSTAQLRLQPLSDIHFNPDYVESPGLLSTLYTLMGLAMFILIIAIINFVNLSTAQSIRRSKEIGVRKVLGSRRTGLIFQFLTETLLLTASATCIAVLLVNPALSGFSSFIPQGVKFDLFNTSTLIFLVVITISTSILAGFYPAKAMSSYSPSINLRALGGYKGSEKWYLRRGLIIFQFSISLFFIIGTLIIGNQVRFIQSKDKGFATSDIITFRCKRGDRPEKRKFLAEKIKQISGIQMVALQSMSPMGFAQWTSTIEFKGKSVVKTNVSIKPGGSDFIPFYNIHLAAGRNIAESDSLRELVINFTYLKQLGFVRPEEIIGQFLYYDDNPYPIVGVVDDFHERSFHDPIGPCVIGNFSFELNGIAIKFSSLDGRGGNRKEILTQVENIFKHVYPDETFQSHFIEEEIEWMHEREQKTATLMSVSMMITIFISCLGIFGLAMYTTETRTKEIGIRKVMGATVAEIVTMLSREFTVLIAIALLIASPISWYYLNRWLTEFAYHVDISIWIYVVAGLVAVSVGLISVSFQTIKAAVANPANSLRTE